MPKMCPLDGCKAKHGLCIHDKMTIWMGGFLTLLIGAHWGLGVV